MVSSRALCKSQTITILALCASARGPRPLRVAAFAALTVLRGLSCPVIPYRCNRTRSAPPSCSSASRSPLSSARLPPLRRGRRHLPLQHPSRAQPCALPGVARFRPAVHASHALSVLLCLPCASCTCPAGVGAALRALAPARPLLYAARRITILLRPSRRRNGWPSLSPPFASHAGRRHRTHHRRPLPHAALLRHAASACCCSAPCWNAVPAWPRSRSSSRSAFIRSWRIYASASRSFSGRSMPAARHGPCDSASLPVLVADDPHCSRSRTSPKTRPTFTPRSPAPTSISPTGSGMSCSASPHHSPIFFWIYKVNRLLSQPHARNRAALCRQQRSPAASPPSRSAVLCASREPLAPARASATAAHLSHDLHPALYAARGHACREVPQRIQRSGNRAHALRRRRCNVLRGTPDLPRLRASGDAVGLPEPARAAQSLAAGLPVGAGQYAAGCASSLSTPTTSPPRVKTRRTSAPSRSAAPSPITRRTAARPPSFRSWLPPGSTASSAAPASAASGAQPDRPACACRCHMDRVAAKFAAIGQRADASLLPLSQQHRAGLQTARAARRSYCALRRITAALSSLTMAPSSSFTSPYLFAGTSMARTVYVRE